MSVDYSVDTIYGFKLNTDKVIDFIRDKNINFYDFCEQVQEETNCEMIYNNHYVDAKYCDIYFGIRFENRITAANLYELEQVRYEEVCDTLISIFGSYEIVENGEFEPEIHVVGVVW